MADEYRSIDPSDFAVAMASLSDPPLRSVDPSDIVSVIKDSGLNARAIDRSDLVVPINVAVGDETEPPPDGGGGEPQPSEPVPILSLWNTNPAKVMVAAGELGKFHTDDVVTMAGVPDPYGTANGQKIVGSVLADGFELVSVDLSAAPTNISDPGMTVTPAEAAP